MRSRLFGIVTVSLGIGGFRRAKTLRRGRGMASTCIVLGGFALVSSFLMPVLNAQRESAMRHVAESLVGQTSPPFTFGGQDGGSVFVTDTTLRGTGYILDFRPGPDSFPKLDQLYQKHKDDGLRVFAVYPEDIGKKVNEFVHSRGFGVYVLTYSNYDALPAPYRVSGPETVVVGRDGSIIKVLFDANYEGEIEDSVRAALTTK